jgi:hypothetical protein
MPSTTDVFLWFCVGGIVIKSKLEIVSLVKGILLSLMKDNFTNY